MRRIFNGGVKRTIYHEEMVKVKKHVKILQVLAEKKRYYSNETFEGICLDIGAQVTVSGKEQAQEYCK